MARYTFTDAAGNRILGKCLAFNKEHTLGEVPLFEVEMFLSGEGYRGQYAVHEFVRWLKKQSAQCSAAIVLGLVALGMASELVRDREFIDTVEAFHDAMNRRFGKVGE
jgi:hypothetical protein